MHKSFTQNLRNLLLTTACLAASATIQAAGTKTTYTVKVQRTVGQDVSQCTVYPEALLKTLGSTATTLGSALSGSVKLWAVQPSGRYYSSSTYGTRGHSFNNSGTVITKTSKKRAIYIDLNTSTGFLIGTVDSMLTAETVYTVREALVNSSTADTVVYEFQVSLGSTASVVSDEPSFIHRADIMDSWVVRPYVQQNDQAGEYSYCLQVNAGDRATIGARPLVDGQSVRTRVTNPDGDVVKGWSASDYELTSAETTDAGAYVVQVRVYNESNKIIKTDKYTYYLDVQTEQGKFYDWKEHTTVFSYNYTDEFPNGFAQPTKSHNILKKDGTAANRVDGDWWCAYWGDNLNSEVDGNNKNAFTNMVEKFDDDFAYIRDEMGWPPDANIQNGWRSYIYTFGSGLANDDADNTEKGGYQSAAYVDGGSWVCVWASYYPVSRFRDDADQKYTDGSYQREAMIHEGLHAVLASMGGCKNAAWFQEAGNTWLQAKMSVLRYGVAGDAGFLDGSIFIAPFMPVECYSGWLQDGSFGGPSAEGSVNMYTSSGQQICTWRNILGGTQYANGFGIFLGEAVGNGAVPWIWRYAKSRVLEGIAEGSEGVAGIGDEATRSLILQYRAKQATFDLGEFAKSYRNVMAGNFGGYTGPEWEPYYINCGQWKMTPYAPMTKNDAEGWLAPDTLTNPGWSGGNQIPIHVSGNHCEVFFRPEDTNMRAQLCYRTKDGDCYYSQPVLCGKMELNWDENSAPANNVVFAVVANTDYKFTGVAQLKHHWDYRIKLGEGALAVASKDARWFLWEETVRDEDFETGIEEIQANANPSNHASAQSNGDDLGIRITSSVLHAGGTIQFDLGTNSASDIVAHLTGLSGVMIDEQPMSDNGTIRLPHTLPNGMYVLTLARGDQQQSYKVFVK